MILNIWKGIREEMMIIANRIEQGRRGINTRTVSSFHFPALLLFLEVFFVDIQIIESNTPLRYKY